LRTIFSFRLPTNSDFMRLVLKILKLFAILIITVMIILFSASFFLQNKVADIILASLNDKITTKLDISSFRLSFLKKFPKASLELTGVIVHSSSGFNTQAFHEENTDTLLSASTVSIEFKITDILKGIYDIQRISARDGKINIYTDTAGLVNYDIKVKNAGSEDKDFALDLDRINLIDIKTHYNNLATRLVINGVINNGKVKSRISGSEIDFTAGAEIQIEDLQLYNTKLTKPISAEIGVNLQSSAAGILLRKGTLKIEDYDFSLDGNISHDNMIDLNITGNNIDIEKIRNYLPDKYLKLVSEYDPSGTLVVNSKIKGLLTRTSNPHIEISCQLNDGRVTYGKSDLTINNLSFKGYYSNGSKNRPESSSVVFRELSATLGSSEYSGTFKLAGFDHPVIEFSLKGRVFPGELKEFFNLQDISEARGSFDIDLKTMSFLLPKEKLTFDDVIDLKPEADLVFNSLTIGLKNNKLLLNNVNGNLNISNFIQTKNFEFSYKGQRIKVDGKFKNLPEWLADRPVSLIASADISFDRFIPEAFLTDISSSDEQSLKKKGFIMPGGLFLDINFEIDSLNYKAFSSTKISGTFNYKPQLLTFKTFNMKSLNGMISGNGFIVQNRNKSMIVRGSFNVNDIEITQAFSTFKNFGQSFIKSENLAGTLSGSLSLLLPLDSMLKPKIKEITAEGKYILINGALLNFGPVKQLSSFIELSELENIHFEKLENDFFIKNNFMYTPQMDVKSTAADLTINGKHSFDNDYEYHVRILLSEILSKKRKKSRSNNSEFGVVEDDGLGRTSLLLKIQGKGDDVKTGYDVKVAGNVVKNNIKAERKTIKTILNQEYGWFKKDSVQFQEPVKKKSRFRITFDGTDTTKIEPETKVVKKESLVKNLLKKK
jgi:hypothetical protein